MRFNSVMCRNLDKVSYFGQKLVSNMTENRAITVLENLQYKNIIMHKYKILLFIYFKRLDKKILSA